MNFPQLKKMNFVQQAFGTFSSLFVILCGSNAGIASSPHLFRKWDFICCMWHQNIGVFDVIFVNNLTETNSNYTDSTSCLQRAFPSSFFALHHCAISP